MTIELMKLLGRGDKVSRPDGTIGLVKGWNADVDGLRIFWYGDLTTDEVLWIAADRLTFVSRAQ